MKFKYNFLPFYLFTLSLIICQTENPRNGKWWNELEEGKKIDYLVGFLDGMDLGLYFSYLELKENNDNEKIIKQIIKSYNTNKKKFFNNKTYKGIIDEIDYFYNDNKNMEFRPRIALYLVLLKLANTESPKIEKIKIELLKLNKK